MRPAALRRWGQDGKGRGGGKRDEGREGDGEKERAAGREGKEVEEHLGRGVLLTPPPLGLAQPWAQAGKAPAPLS